MSNPLRTFSSFAQFAEHLIERQALVTHELRSCLGEVVERIKDTAVDELGHYQPAIGPFQAWAELAPTTKEDRVQKGYTENDPLLRSGELRSDIRTAVSGLEGVVGSTREEAVYLELGTDKMPPRAFLGPALLHNEEYVKHALGAAMASGLLGRGVNVSTLMTSRRISR